MKHSAIRLCCAVLLMLLALAVSVAAIGAAGRKTGPFVWVRLHLAAEKKTQEVCLYSADGAPLQTLQTDDAGEVVSGLLTPGKYYAVTRSGCTEFTLHDDASVSADGGLGWSDGETLHLTGEKVGTVCVERLVGVQTLARGEWLDYTLSGGGIVRREVLRCKAAGETLRCTFEGVPYGSYVLKENGVEQCRVTVGEEALTVCLP